jgi:hypothetical protein
MEVVRWAIRPIRSIRSIRVCFFRWLRVFDTQNTEGTLHIVTGHQ